MNALNVCIPNRILFVAVVVGLVVGLTVPAQADLMGRLEATPGLMDYQAYYDDDLDITWAADANLAKTSGFDSDGLMIWSAANTWAMNVTISGVSGWRLPTTTQPDATCSIQDLAGTGADAGFNCTGSEMGHLFYVEGITGAAPSPFSNVQGNNFYWSGTEFAPKTRLAWDFPFGFGNQAAFSKFNGNFAWAVHNGDVEPPAQTPIPEPSTIFLFGTGIVGLMVYRKMNIWGHCLT